MPSHEESHVGEESADTLGGRSHRLDYASPSANRWGTPLFRTTLVIFATLGILTNLTIIYGVVSSLHRNARVYDDLTLNPRAYGRLIDPETIAWLGENDSLGLAELALLVAAAFGTLLAVQLMATVVLLDGRPDSQRRLEQYRRWKSIGAVLTAVAFLWSGTRQHYFWVAATNHVAIGSGPPVFTTVLLFGCALLPRWWIGKGQGSTRSLMRDMGATLQALPSRMSLASMLVGANYLTFGIGIFFNFFGGEIDRLGATLCRWTYWFTGPLAILACLYSPLRRFVLPARRWDVYGPLTAITGYILLDIAFGW